MTQVAVIVEYDGAAADAERRRWVGHRVPAGYQGEGFVLGAWDTRTVGGDWAATSALMTAERLAAWLNERDGVS